MQEKRSAADAEYINCCAPDSGFLSLLRRAAASYDVAVPRASGACQGESSVDDRRTVIVALGGGESRQLLVESGTTLLVVSGRVVLRRAVVWLAETPVSSEAVLASEAVEVIEAAGWIELVAAGPAEVALIPSDRVGLWRKVGRCLSALAGSAAKESASAALP